MDNLWDRMESSCGARLARHVGVLPAGADEQARSDRPVFSLHWVTDQRRLRARTSPVEGDEASARSGVAVARLIVGSDRAEADEEPAATRAILESRIVGQVLAEGRSEAAPPTPELIERLPFPNPEPVFAEQLAILARRAAEGGEIGWAIERVVAEMYELELDALVDLQARIRAGG